jgi:hypothetical protein
VRNKWQTLQAQLFETAYPIAQKAQQLINSGSDKEASQLLTNYMTKNTQTMLDTVTKLLRNFERQAA